MPHSSFACLVRDTYSSGFRLLDVAWMTHAYIGREAAIRAWLRDDTEPVTGRVLAQTRIESVVELVRGQTEVVE